MYGTPPEYRQTSRKLVANGGFAFPSFPLRASSSSSSSSSSPSSCSFPLIPSLYLCGNWRKMFPQQWSSPCGNHCTHKYAALMQIPWRVFCKKGCDADGETWEECLAECEEICYKDPVFKDQQWSAYIDRSPGADNYSAECFHACVAGCGYKFSISSETVDQIHPKRPVKPCPESKLPPTPVGRKEDTEDMPSTSA